MALSKINEKLIQDIKLKILKGDYEIIDKIEHHIKTTYKRGSGRNTLLAIIDIARESLNTNE